MLLLLTGASLTDGGSIINIITLAQRGARDPGTRDPRDQGPRDPGTQGPIYNQPAPWVLAYLLMLV